MALFAVADALFERGQKVERDVRGLKVPTVGLRDVVDERAERRRSWRSDWFLSAR